MVAPARRPGKSRLVVKDHKIVVASTLAPFPERDVAITLTGSEWVAVIARILGKPLSVEGAGFFNSAGKKIQQQLSLENSRS